MIKFIAEIGLNYNGNIDLCYELIKHAKYSGADFAKFQLGWKSKENEINHLDLKKITLLKKWCSEFNIEILFSVFDRNSLVLYKKLKPSYFKIPSRLIINNFNLCNQIISQKKTTYISLGMWDKKEFPFKYSKNIKYLWCRSYYPTHDEHLKNFPKIFSEKKNRYYGYSDHCIGIETCLLAISRGAKIIEKHFTLDKSDQTIRDHSLSATPDEFLTMVKIGKEINKKIEKKI